MNEPFTKKNIFHRKGKVAMFDMTTYPKYKSWNVSKNYTFKDEDDDDEY